MKLHLIFDPFSVWQPNFTAVPASAVKFVGVVGCIVAFVIRPVQLKLEVRDHGV